MKAGWEVRPLRDVCRLINGRAYKQAELLEAGPYPVLRVGNFFTNNHWYYSDLELDADKYCDDGDLLYAWSASFGPRIWQGGKVIYHYHIWKVAPQTQRLDRDYLYYFFDWDKELIKKEQGAGTTMIHVSKGSMEARSIPLPPLEEQQRIVAVLDEAFEGLARARAHAEANLQNARELFDAALTAMFTNPPAEWKPATLASKCNRITVGHVGPMANRYTGSGVIFLRSQNVRPFRIDLTDVKYIGEEFVAELKKSELRPGDVAIVRTGYPGVCAVIPDDIPLANCADLVIARTGPDLSPHFLAMLLNSSFGKQHVAHVSVGAAQQHFNVSSAKAAVFPMPPIAEQKRLVERSDEIRAQTTDLEKGFSRKLNEIDALRQSLLQKAFAGELT